MTWLNAPLLPTQPASGLKLILDLRAVTLELRAHPQVCLVIPNGASVIGRDERVARRLNRASRNNNLLVGNPARTDANDATTLRVNHRRLLQHRRDPQAVRRQGGGGSDKRTALAHYAKSLWRRRALDVEGLAVLRCFTSE